MKKMFWLSAFVFAVFASNVYAQALTKADVEKIVQEYIVSNGGVIADSVDKYLAEKRREASLGLVSAHTPVYGKADAKVTVIEFSDFRCGYCKRVQETMVNLRAKYKDDVRFVFKNMPILSEESRAAALANMAAHKQGKFWEYSAKLWDNQSRLGEELFVEIAKDLKLDLKKFNADRNSEEVMLMVQTDFLDGQDAGVQGTPHFVIDGNPLSGAQPEDSFVSAIEAALKASK